MLTKFWLAFCAVFVQLNSALGQATCTPNNCIRNYVTEKLWDIQRRLIQEGNGPILFPEEFPASSKATISNLDFRVWNSTATGFLSNMVIRVGRVSSDVLYGKISFSTESNGMKISGDYSAQGSVHNTTDISTSGRFEIKYDTYQYFHAYYNVTESGLLNFQTRESVYYSYYTPTPANIWFENFLSSSNPLLPTLNVYHTNNIISRAYSQTNLLWRKFLQYFKDSLQDVPLTDITSWSGIPTAPPTTPRPTTEFPPTTQPPPLYSCFPDDCIRSYLTNQLKLMGDYAVQEGLESLPLNRTFFNRTLTTVFDLDLTYFDVKVEGFLEKQIIWSPITSQLLTGSMQFYSELSSLMISGTYKGNGTVLGLDVDTEGHWSGYIDVINSYTLNYNISSDGELNVISSSSRLYAFDKSYGFETDMFQKLHPLKEPFDTLVGTQIGRAFGNVIYDLGPYLMEYLTQVLKTPEFFELITGINPPTYPTLAPTPLTTVGPNTPAPFECTPDECLLDYVKAKFSRFPDWVDIDERDPLILPDRYNVSFLNSIWNVALTLSNITVHGYLPTFLNAQTTMRSDCLSGTITINTYSPLLKLTGRYASNGSLAEYSLDGEGDWSMNLSISSDLIINYRIDDNGFTSELRNIFTTRYRTKNSVSFVNLVDPSVPLADLLVEDIATKSSTLVSKEIRTFTPLITDFMYILLTENTFYDIITWHRYGNETTEPPIICPESRSSVQIVNWWVPLFGQVPMLIRGSRLDILKTIECRFSDISDVFVEGVVIDFTTASCTVPYLYSVGWVEVEILLSFANGCEQRYKQSIYSAKPDDINNMLEASLVSNEISLSWNQKYFSSSELELHLIELDRELGRWIPRGIVISSLPNNGIYLGQIDENILEKVDSSFVVYLSPKDSDTVKYMHSDVLYTDYGRTKEYFQTACVNWFNQDNGPPKNIEPCPPLLAQAWRDNRFEYEWDLQNLTKLNFYHPGAELSFRQLIPNAEGAGSQCVYKNDSILIGALGGGTADLSSPNNRTGFIGHHINDIYPWYICCNYAQDESSCQNYYTKRPSDAGLNYIPPIPGIGDGDPHISTFDGVSYTFNGVGEFWMVQPSSDFDFTLRNTKLGMQARMERFIDLESGELRNASTFTAFAMQEWNSTSSTISVQVSLTYENPPQLEVLANGIQIQIPEEYNFKSGKPFIAKFEAGTAIALHLTTEGRLNTVTMSFNSGFAFNISVVEDQHALNIISSVSEELNVGGYQGLLGSYDGIPENDLTYPGGPYISVENSTLREIHDNFGLKWRTLNTSSIFLYDFGTGHSDYQDLDFEPTFEEPKFEDFPEAVDICGKSKECLFDYVSTGNVEFAKETKEFVEEFKEIEETFKEEVVMCRDELTSPENGKLQVDNYIVGSIATFSCDSDYTLEGNSQVTCASQGKWDSEEPTCIIETSGFDCSGKSDGYYPNTLDCGTYYGCLRGVLYEYSCPHLLFFDSIKLFCVQPSLAVCAK